MIKAYCAYKYSKKYTIFKLENQKIDCLIYLYGHETCSNALAVHILEMFIDRKNWLAWIGTGTQTLWIAAYTGVKVQNIRLLLQYHKSKEKV